MTTDNPESSLPISTGSIMSLSNDQKSVLIKRAKSGDSESAFRLYQFYAFSTSDVESSIKWLKISAKNGQPLAQQHLAVHFLQRKNFKCAKYWTRKTELNGNTDGAKRLMNEILETEIRKK